jgi:hypothetical protein
MSSNVAIMYFKEIAVPVEEGLGAVKYGHYTPKRWQYW